MSDKKDTLCDEVISLFTSKFSKKPDVVGCAPGRVNLIGEHTDYQEGFVFPVALDRKTVVALSLNDSGRYIIVSADLQREIAFTEPPTIPPSSKDASSWYSYVLGSIACFCDVAKIPYPKGFNIMIKTTVPIGSGLSSSAALEVATASAMEAATKTTLPDLVKARDVCQRAEHQWAKMPCGLMDQAIAVMGRQGSALLLDCKSQIGRQAPLDAAIALLVVNSGVTHSLVSGEYAERKSTCASAVNTLKKTFYPEIASLRDVTPEMLETAKASLSPLEYRRSFHVVHENVRAEQFYQALQRGDVTTAGSLMYEGHWSLKDNYDVTVPETDAIVTVAKEVDGVYGARMTGGGFGGSVCVLVDASKAESTKDQIFKKYLDAYKALAAAAGDEENVHRREPSIFVAHPSRGAHALVVGQS